MQSCHSEATALETNGARIYLNPNTVPLHPGDQWTRFVCISDTHNSTPAVPDGDVLLHAGDISAGGVPEDMKSMFDWLRGLPHQTKVYVRLNALAVIISPSHLTRRVIAGNHDVRLNTTAAQSEFISLQLPAMFGQELAGWRSF